MPLHREPAFTQSREEFCAALKAARERKGITLAQIAASTKISSFHLAALERGDLRRWPKGLFRRSFFRDYVRMIGIPVDETCTEFVRWFPDEDMVAAGARPAAAGAAPRADEVRLVLDAEWHGPRAAIRPRLIAVAIDAAVVVIISLVMAWTIGLDIRATSAMVALAYFSLGTALFGESPGKRAIAATESWRRELAEAETEAPEEQEWISDARRVGPEPPSPLRVRFKLQ